MSSALVEPEIVELHAIFRGRVQGVGFRATVRHYATKLELSGSVKNLSDGSLELYAQGKKEVLEDLLSSLKKDAGIGQIESVAADYSEKRREFLGFSISF